MSVSIPIPEKRERSSSIVILSTRWSESQALVKLQFKDVVEITLKDFEDDIEWIALTKEGMDQGDC